MANALYDSARQLFLEGQLDWRQTSGGTYQAYLIDTSSYSVNLTTHVNLSDVGGSSRIAGPVSLSGRTTTGGAADATDITFQAVSGASIEAIIICKYTGSEATSPLIAYIDTASGLPITPNGGDIIVTWDNGTNKIFKL